jgi:hypothetical protein
MAEAVDRPDRGALFLSADAVFTIGADGKLLECRVLRSQYVGRDRPRGAPPSPCTGWDLGNNLYLPAAEGTGTRTVNVKVRGYVGPGRAAAPPVARAPLPAVPAAPAHALAGLNWQTCLEDRARRLALDAVSKRAPMPDADSVLQACAEQENRLRSALAASGGTSANWAARRATARSQAHQLLESTWRSHNYD